jgi:hypothetical protein
LKGRKRMAIRVEERAQNKREKVYGNKSRGGDQRLKRESV